MYAQFYQTDLAGNLSLVCGDRGIIKLDGREQFLSHIKIAENHGRQYGFVAYQFIMGDRINSPVHPVLFRVAA